MSVTIRSKITITDPKEYRDFVTQLRVAMDDIIERNNCKSYTIEEIFEKE